METGLISVEVFCRLHNVALDIAAVRRRYFVDGQEDLQEEEILRTLKDGGFRTKSKEILAASAINRYTPPVIFRDKCQRYHVIVSVKENAVLVFNSSLKAAHKLSFEQLQEIWGGRIIVAHPRNSHSNIQLGFRWLFYEFLRFRSIFSEVLLSSFFIQVFGLVTPLFFQIVFDKVLAHGAATTLRVVAISFLTIIVFDTVFGLMRNYLLYHTANKIDAGLGSRVYRHLLSVPYHYFETRKVGNIITRVRELETLRQFMTNISLTVLLDSVFSVLFLVMMCLYSVSLTLMVFGFVVVIAAISLLTTPSLRALLEDKFQKGAQSQSFLVESITGIQTVKSLAIEGKMVKDWENNLGQYILAAFKVSNLSSIAHTASQAVQKLMTLAVIYFGVDHVLGGEISVGQLVAFNMFASQVSGPILRLAHTWQDFQQAKISLERLGDIINTPTEAMEGNIAVKELNGEIVFKNVSFKYSPDGPLVIDKVSFSIPSGTMVGVVGKSGSGKSTLIKMIQRLYLPIDGVIFIDGIDVRHFNPTFLRYKMGVVPQECFLFSGTIKENIAIASPNTPLDTIVSVCQLSGAHQFISEMPKGYDTMVEERGASLSGGQRQRIAIARALITNPRIIIFDEATAALDYESENLIHASMDKIRKGRTVITIAHRLSTMRSCDWLIVMDRGRITEIGTHEELLKSGGIYAELQRQQVR